MNKKPGISTQKRVGTKQKNKQSPMKQAKYPSLYQINTRVWLTQLSQDLGRQATLDDITDIELDRLADMGFDWIWLLSVWATGELGRKVSLSNPEWRHDFEKTLPDLREEDIRGSGFGVVDFHVPSQLGGDKALKRLRTRLNKRGIKLMLDFVPNHLGLDHPWAEKHPEYFIPGTEDDLKNNPLNYTKLKHKKADRVFAYGRDPNFSGWPDSLQLDYSNPAVVEAMTKELLRISGQCDGVRCDMAMLILPEIFERTWNRKVQSFWPEAIKAVREKNPEFCFMAEVYWGMEWTLQQMGFDYAYDKRLYDRLCEGHARPVREHLYAGLDYQKKLARFLENHDELRAASVFDPDKHKAAAIITFLTPGLRFFHQGQLEGRKKHISIHLVRAPHEPVDPDLHIFYTNLLAKMRMPLFRNGQWCLLECTPAWEGNGSWDAFLAFSWELDGIRSLVAINFAPHKSQCFVKLRFPDLANRQVEFADLMSTDQYERDGNDLVSRGIYLDLRPWGYHVFHVNFLPSANA